MQIRLSEDGVDLDEVELIAGRHDPVCRPGVADLYRIQANTLD